MKNDQNKITWLLIFLAFMSMAEYALVRSDTVLEHPVLAPPTEWIRILTICISTSPSHPGLKIFLIMLIRFIFLGDGGTPKPPSEKEEGELDTTQGSEPSRHDRIDYNALDFEEDIEHDGNCSWYCESRWSVVYGVGDVIKWWLIFDVFIDIHM